MNSSVKVAIASLLSRRLFTRPVCCVHKVPRLFLSDGPSDASSDSKRRTISFSESLRKVKDSAPVASSLSDSSSSDSSDSSDEEISRHSKSKHGDTLLGYKTTESDPTNHTMDHEGVYYTINPEDQKLYFPNLINPMIKEQANAFGELPLMIRKPALEIINVMKNSNYNCPLPKFIIYGQRGAGKTCTLNHVMHYCAKQNHMLLHIPWVNDWIRYHTSSTPSLSRAGFTNIPEQANTWIAYFAAINAPLIKDMKVTKDIEWTKKEVTEAGSPLKSLIDFGLLRQKYADDVVDALLNEVITHASNNKFKVLVAIDGLNGFYRPTTLREPLEKRLFIQAKDLCLVDSFRRLLSSGNKNIMAVCTVSEEINPSNEREKFTPFYLLGKEAFQELEPFIPIHVDNYTEKEVNNCLHLYENKQWLQNPAARTEAGHQQIKFLTNNNPFAVSRLCASN
ncbi:small ribosomal subunit protein mS29-like [Argopecten irradians]|uniref:small ribosomal subunit protein mS29-like n=1 Tax=Argopecten irradians TaxID=31199 RepID=UPI00371099DC